MGRGPAFLGFATRKGLDIHAFSVTLSLEKIEAITSPSC